MIPSNEEINAIVPGDIVIVYWSKSGGYCENNTPVSQNEDIRLKFLVLTRDSNNYIVGSLISNISSLNGSDKLPKFLKFDPSSYGEVEFEIILANLAKNSPALEFDKEKTRYVYEGWIFEIEKFQKKNIDPGGMFCCECNEFYRYAIANLSNRNLACWSCRDSYKWKYSELFMGSK